MMQKINMLDLHYKNLSIRQQSDLLNLNRSSLYYKHNAIKKEHDIFLMNEIQDIWNNIPQYGYRKISKELSIRLNVPINHKRVQRLMNLMNITAIYPKKYNYKKNNLEQKFPYLLDNVKIIKSNQVFSTDITYIKILTGFVYLVAIIDVYSRYVVSWKLSNTLDADFCIELLTNTLQNVVPEIINMDQGSQFTSSDWIDLLKSYSVKISMTGKGRCIDNVYIERLWRTIKYENIYLMGYDNIDELNIGLDNFIKFYNYKRLHQSLNYNTPYYVYSGGTLN